MQNDEPIFEDATALDLEIPGAVGTFFVKPTDQSTSSIPVQYIQTHVETAVHGALERGLKTGAAMSVGALIVFLDGGLLSIPASMLTRIGIDRFRSSGRICRRVDSRMLQARALLPAYN